MPQVRFAITTVALVFLILLIPFKTTWISSAARSLSELSGSELSAVAFAQDENKEKKTTAPGEKGGEKKKPGEKKPGEGKVDKPCPECPDPSKIVLEGLEEKRATISKAEERLNQEKKRLDKFKQEIDEKLDKLTVLKQQIDADFVRLEEKKSEKERQKQEAFDAKMNSLVKMYSGMKPKKAAAIFDKMDLEVAKQIFSLMQSNSAGQILAFVESEKAAKISERIAYKKK